MVAGVALALERIDLSRHDGVHPRVGVADVLPLVAIRPEDIWSGRGRPRSQWARGSAPSSGCRSSSTASWRPGAGWRSFAAAAPRSLRAGSRAASSSPTSGLRGSIRARGAVLVGARLPLIAFNVNLRGSLAAAKEIAAAVREGGGGFAGVRALGLELPGAGLVQVSMNIEDWQKSGPGEIVARIEREAAERGAEVAATELVGLIPAGAAAEAEQVGLSFSRSEILELRLEEPRRSEP